MHQDIIPMLTYENGVAAMEWLCHVFGFKEKTKWLDEQGSLTHGELQMGNSIIMLADGNSHYKSPANHQRICEQAKKWYSVPYIINGLLIYVHDVPAHFENSKKLGAGILSGLEYGDPGTRYRVEDLEGQRWMFIQKS
jgi:uncharacterized glyoxalase superfamily protein PhnB